MKEFTLELNASAIAKANKVSEPFRQAVEKAGRDYDRATLACEKAWREAYREACNAE